MKNIFSLFCFASIVLGAFCINSFDTQAQTVLFSETFNEASNSTTGTSAEGISWAATCPACLAGDYYYIVNGAMEGQDTNGAAEWVTGNITVPMGTQFITLTTTYNSIGYAGSGNLESQDECGSCPCDPSVVTTNGSCNNCWDYVAYTVSSGGSTVGNDILLGCAGTSDDGSLCQPLDVSSLTAGGPATITMEVEMAMWATGEKLSFDNVIITAYTAAQATAAGVSATSCPAPPICDLTLGTAAITCNASTSGTSDAVTINVPYTGVDPDAVLSILVNGSAASNTGSNPAVTANGTITFAATEGATYSVGFTDATCNLQSLSGTVSTTQCLAGCAVSIASVTPTCNGTNYNLAVTFTHSSPISTAAANITVKDGATTLASQSNVTTTGSSQTVNFTNVSVGNATPGITVTVADVNSGAGGGSTTLAAGNIAFVQFNSDVTKSFAFVALVPIPAGTVIVFTDNGWLSVGGFRSGEGTATWTAPIGGVSCGSVVTISGSGTTVATTTGTVVGTASFDFSASGDQIIAYQGTAASPTLIAALNDEGSAVWQSDATNTNTSALPTGLTNGSTAVALTELDNYKYNASVTSGTAATIRTAINTATNWIGDDAVNQTYSGAFTVTGCGGGPTCEATATFTEPDCTICTNPPTVAPEGPYTTCVGDAVLLGDAAFGGSATMAQWSITAAAGGATIADGTLSNTAMTATPATVTFTGAVAGTYTLTLTSNNPLGAPCTAASVTTTVNVIADQVGTLSYPKATYCANEADPTPTVTGGSADDEFTSTTGLVIDASTGVVDLSASTPGTYTVTYRTSLSAACPGFATFSITINAAPTAGISITETSGTANDGTVCAGSAITLTGTGGTSYNWTLPDASTSTTNPQSIASAVAANAGTYTVTVTNASGCTATTTTAVVVNALPTADITIAETSGTANDGTVCTGSAITLTATGGTSYNWTLPDASTSTTNPQSIASAVAANAGTYTVTVTNASGCTATATTAVVVNALPTAGISITETSGTANDGTVCAGSAITLTATGGTSYNWTLPDASTSTTNPQSIASAVAANAGTYTVTVTNAAGCANTATTTVVVNALPTAGISITETSGTANDGTVCAGSAITLTATGGTSYNWTLPDASTSTTNPQSIASAVAANAGTYTVTVTNASGCTATTTTAVVVNNIPTFTGTASCSGGTNTGSISQTATGGSGSYTYGITGGSFGPTLANGTYTVTVTSNGCSATAEVIVNCAGCVTPTPTAAKSGNLSCTVSSVTLSVSGLLAGPAYTYQWTGGSTNATLNVSTQGTYTVTVTNPSNGGCTATSSITVARRCTAITDPCSCVNDASSPVGAAPNDGHFNEVIAIWNDLDGDTQIDAGEDLAQTSPAEIAYITTQSGMLNLSNVAYPTSPAFGTLSLTYGNIPATINADGSIATLTGVMGYYLVFRHIDAAGYTANVTIDEDGSNATMGDQYPEPAMTATCFYPNPTFSPVLTSPLCTTDAAITLGSAPSGASFTINSIAATSFDPATLGTTPNPHVVELTLDPAGDLGGATPAASGCIQAIKANVVVQNCVICMPNAGSW